MEIAHQLFLDTFGGKLHLAPVFDPLHEVLDIGTGTGSWAIGMADAHDTARVTGTDLSPIQPLYVPTKCEFQVDDADSTMWTWKDNWFDFIHVRSLSGCISSWPTFYQECLRVLKPGGWLEQSEFSPAFESKDGTVTDDTTMGNWGKHLQECFDIVRLKSDILCPDLFSHLSLRE